MMRSLICLLLSFTASSALAASEKYTIDPAHTFVVFKISHFGFSHVYGTFDDVSGDFTIDEQHPEKDAINIKIKTDSVSTHVAKRDAHLKSPDFFNAKEFPYITFVSKSVKKTGADKYEVKGDITLHGVTKPVTLKLVRNRTGKGPDGHFHTGVDLTFNMKRSAFNMNFMQGKDMIGDDVDMTVSAEGMRD